MGAENRGPIGIEERARLLELIRRGFGLHMALAEMKTHYRRYARALKKIRGFKGEVRRALEYQSEQLVALRFAAAMDGSERAQEFMIHRNDRAREFAAHMKLRRKEIGKPETSDAPKRIAIPDVDERLAPRED